MDGQPDVVSEGLGKNQVYYKKHWSDQEYSVCV